MPAGRPPKPTALKILQGNPGKRPLNQNEAQPLVCLPEPTEAVLRDPMALRHWNEEGQRLVRDRILTDADRQLWADCCLAYSAKERWTVIVEKVEADGEQFVMNRGSLMAHPAFAQLAKAKKEYEVKAKSFGMDPQSRVKTPTVNGGQKNEWEVFGTSKKA